MTQQKVGASTISKYKFIVIELARTPKGCPKHAVFLEKKIKLEDKFTKMGIDFTKFA